MKLLECKIENFGKLSDVSFAFHGGLQCFQAPNGWGKTTLAAFLKVMFYGFGKERSKQAQKERERYRPWQGGVYGGSLIFEIDGTVFLMERTFGVSGKEDTFALYEEKTGLPSQQYSSEIGKEIFRVDEQSFMRTMYVPGGQCKTQVTDDVHAKIGNVAEQMDDLKEYSRAMGILNKEQNRLSPHRKNSLLSKCKMDFLGLQTELQQEELLSGELGECEGKIERLQQEIADGKQQQQAYSRKLMEKGEAEKQLVKAEQYEKLCQREKKLENQVEVIEEKFNAGLPSLDEVKQMMEVGSEAARYQEAQDEILFTQEEKRVMAQVEQWGGCPDKEEWQLHKNLLEQLEENGEQPETTATKGQKRWIALCSVGIGVFLIGLACCFVFLPAGIGFAFAGAFMGGWAIFQMKEQVDASVSSELQIKEEKQQVQQFLQRYPIEQVEDSMEQMQRLQLIMIQNASIQERKMAMEEKEVKRKEKLEQLFSFLDLYNLKRTESVSELQKLYDLLKEYYELSEAWNAAVEERETFEEENGTVFDASAWQEETVETLHMKLNRTTELLTEKQEQLFLLQTQRENMQTKIDCLEQMKLESRQLEKKIQRLTHQYDVTKQAKFYLQKAKENFTAKYRNPVEITMEQYLSLLTEDTEPFTIDSNFEIRKREKGTFHSMDCFSDGWQDVVSMCQRIALVEAMYPKELPFFLMDDPFVNLDDKNMQGAFRLLERLGGKYQILYFSCNENRIPKELQ